MSVCLDRHVHSAHGVAEEVACFVYIHYTTLHYTTLHTTLHYTYTHARMTDPASASILLREQPRTDTRSLQTADKLLFLSLSSQSPLAHAEAGWLAPSDLIPTHRSTCTVDLASRQRVLQYVPRYRFVL